MTADHTGSRPGRPPGFGFGLGFEVRTASGDAALPGSVGEYGWAGDAGTLFWIDPKEQLIAIYMVQVSDPDRIATCATSSGRMVQAALIDRLKESSGASGRALMSRPVGTALAASA